MSGGSVVGLSYASIEELQVYYAQQLKSGSGFFPGDYNLLVGDTCKAVIVIPGASLLLDAVVQTVHKNSIPGVSVLFQPFDSDQKLTLSQFVQAKTDAIDNVAMVIEPTEDKDDSFDFMNQADTRVDSPGSFLPFLQTTTNEDYNDDTEDTGFEGDDNSFAMADKTVCDKPNSLTEQIENSHQVISPIATPEPSDLILTLEPNTADTENALPDPNDPQQNDPQQNAHKSAEAEVPKIPIQLRFRKLTLPEARKVARSGTLTHRIALERIFGKSVWTELLKNPAITIREVIRIAKMATLPLPIVETIASNRTWTNSPQVRRALLASTKLSKVHARRILEATPKPELRLALKQPSYPHMVRNLAKDILKRAGAL